MDHLDDLSGSPPPPAYSEQEFDQKVSTATELSEAAYREQLQHEESTWEVWDEAIFETAARELSHFSLRSDQGLQAPSGSNQPLRGGATGSSSTPPLRVHKKNPSGGTPFAGKQKPSWLAETEAIGASTSEESTLAAPAYTPGPLSPSVSSTTLPNPYSGQDWTASSPHQALPDPYERGWVIAPSSPALPDPYHGQSRSPGGFKPSDSESLAALPGQPVPNPHSELRWSTNPPRSPRLDSYLDQPWSAVEPSTRLPPLDQNCHLPPPPFPPSSEGGLSSPYDNTRRISAPNLSDSGPPPSTSRPMSLPVQTNFQTNLNLQSSQHSRAETSQNSTIPPYSFPNDSRYTIQSPNIGSRPVNHQVPNQLTPRSAVNAYRCPTLPQNTAVPRLKFDLLAAYGKSPVAKGNDAQPQTVYDATAFYNSAVSAHLPKIGPNQSQSQLYLTPPGIASGLQPIQASTATPSRYSQLPPGAGPSYNPHTASYGSRIRSPTPTYPTGASNPMPQMLAATTERQYVHYPTVPHPTGR